MLVYTFLKRIYLKFYLKILHTRNLIFLWKNFIVFFQDVDAPDVFETSDLPEDDQSLVKQPVSLLYFLLPVKKIHMRISLLLCIKASLFPINIVGFCYSSLFIVWLFHIHHHSMIGITKINFFYYKAPNNSRPTIIYFSNFFLPLRFLFRALQLLIFRCEAGVYIIPY